MEPPVRLDVGALRAQFSSEQDARAHLRSLLSVADRSNGRLVKQAGELAKCVSPASTFQSCVFA